MTDEIVVKHKGIDIKYSEKEDKWVFECRGRERKVTALGEAKSIIEKPPADEKPPFQRIKAWWRSYGDEYIQVTVTSQAESSRSYSLPEVWISYGKNERRKATMRGVYPVSDHNDALIMKLLEIRKQIEALKTEETNFEAKLLPLKSQ